MLLLWSNSIDEELFFVHGMKTIAATCKGLSKHTATLGKIDEGSQLKWHDNDILYRIEDLSATSCNLLAEGAYFNIFWLLIGRQGFMPIFTYVDKTNG